MKAAILQHLSALAVAGVALLATAAHAGDAGSASLRVCASRNAPPYSIEDGSGFEDDGVAARLDRNRSARQARLVDRVLRDRLHVDLRPVGVVGACPP